LGKLLGQQGAYDEAIRQLRFVMERDPDFANAPFELAMVTLQQGNRDGAIAEFEDLLKRHPDHAATQNNLAWLLVTHPDDQRYDPKRALDLAGQAVTRTKGELPDYLDTLAVAEAAGGDFEAAMKTIERAILVARAAQKNAMIPGFEQRRALFQQGKAYPRK
jgi:tetratricopeptide (TPR) repeat protein